MNCIGTYDGTIFYNPANKFCIVSVKTADQSVPAEARSNRRYKDHLIRFTAVGYEIPRTDAVELELDGEWTKGKYGVQLQVEQWREIVPRTKNGVEGYLASGLIKGIGPKTAADIVERFGVDTLDILEHQPERLLEIRGITENKLEDIKASYAENRMLQGIMTLLAPFKITPKTALKIYQYFGPTSVEILEKSPFELCQISGFGFRRVDAIVQKSGGDLHDPMRIKGAVFCALDEGKSKAQAVEDSPGDTDSFEPGAAFIHRPSGTGEVHEQQGYRSSDDGGDSGDGEDLGVYILHDLFGLGPYICCRISRLAEHHGHHHTQEGAVSHFGQRKPALGLGIRLLKLRSLRGFRFLQFAILQF